MEATVSYVLVDREETETYEVRLPNTPDTFYIVASGLYVPEGTIVVRYHNGEAMEVKVAHGN